MNQTKVEAVEVFAITLKRELPVSPPPSSYQHFPAYPLEYLGVLLFSSILHV